MGGGGGKCVYCAWRGGKLSQYCCQSVQYAAPLKGWTGCSELKIGRGGREALLPTINGNVFEGSIGAMADRFIILGDVLDG